jgi:hypothetical protein
MMLTVSFERQLREAFAAGKAAGAAPWIAQHKGGEQVIKGWPLTYEEWIAKMSERPSIMRG